MCNKCFSVENKYIFEIGGKGNDFRQIKTIKNAILVKDDLEYAVGNSLAHWQFGLLY